MARDVPAGPGARSGDCIRNAFDRALEHCRSTRSRRAMDEGAENWEKARPGRPTWTCCIRWRGRMTTFAASLTARAFRGGKRSAAREAGDSVWTSERLGVHVRAKLESSRLFVVSNREPYLHIHEGKAVQVMVPASGLVTALEPILRACDGTWVAHGSGDADREDRGQTRLPARPARGAALHPAPGLAQQRRGRRLLLRICPTKGFGLCAILPTPGRCSVPPIGSITSRSINYLPMLFWKRWRTSSIPSCWPRTITLRCCRAW